MITINDETVLRCKGCGDPFVVSSLIKVFGEKFPKTFENGLPRFDEDRYLPRSYHLHCQCDKTRNKALAFFDGERLRVNEKFAEVVK